MLVLVATDGLEPFGRRRSAFCLIAEAPPSILDRYFYFPDVPTQDSLFREVVRAVLSAEPTRQNKRELLIQLQEQGVFLIDAVLEPVGRRYEIPVGRLVGRVRRLLPEKVIVVKVGVFDRVFAPLRDAGIPVAPVRVRFRAPGSRSSSVGLSGELSAIGSRVKVRS